MTNSLYTRVQQMADALVEDPSRMQSTIELMFGEDLDDHGKYLVAVFLDRLLQHTGGFIDA